MEIDYYRLKEKAKVIRKHIIKMIAEANSGHPGGALSLVEIITALFFGGILRYDPKNPLWEDRDRLILSKGHACAVLYAALAEAGYFPVEELLTFRKINSRLQGHPDRVKTPGVEISTGSLGQGLSVGVGVALAGKLDRKDYHVYVVIGDGESDEGQIWEAAMSANRYHLDNLTAILDRNMLQIDGNTEEVMCLEPLREKWLSFGWNVREIDGHNYDEIFNALSKDSIIPNKPRVVIAHTIKGRGVSFMENAVDFHGKPPTKEQAAKALEEIEKQ